MPSHHHYRLKRRLASALDRYRIKPARFGRDLFNDPNFLSRWTGNYEPRQKTCQAIEEYLNALENVH